MTAATGWSFPLVALSWNILSLVEVLVVGAETPAPLRVVPVGVALGDIFAMFPGRVRAVDSLRQESSLRLV
jgi:hypothetical protein